jgi:nitrite reductase/ring-hydroxylating ferredoxin subunit
MAKQITVCPVSDLPPGAVTGAGPYAVGNIDGKYFAVTRRCRHLRADLAGGSIEDGRLVCPWHQSAYDVEQELVARQALGDEHRCTLGRGFASLH